MSSHRPEKGVFAGTLLWAWLGTDLLVSDHSLGTQMLELASSDTPTFSFIGVKSEVKSTEGERRGCVHDMRNEEIWKCVSILIFYVV